MKLKYSIISALIVSQVIAAQTPLKKFINNPLLENANVSLLVRDLQTNETLYGYRANNTAVTASTMKTVTTATAMELFGADFRFETKIEIDGEISDSILNGNLYIRGGGDPTLGSAKLGNADFLKIWADTIRKSGIKKITGRIIADPSIFDKNVINRKWTWEDIGNYYAPGIHGISYLDNTYKAYFNSGAPGTKTQLVKIEPEIGGLEIDNQVMSAKIGYDNAYFFGAPFSYKRYVTGEIPTNKTNFIVKGDIPEPALLLAQHLHTQLINSGISITKAPIVEYKKTDSRKVIYTYYSPTLAEIITETNVKSNNHFAEYLFRYIGTLSGTPATTESSIENIRSYWKKKGLPVDQLFQYDGSGLSPVDGVSAEFFVDLLTYMKKNSKYSETYFNSLPVSGVNGTMVSVLDKTRLQGKVHAKSGTLENVKCYTGYIDLNNRTLVFAILVNNPNGTSHAVINRIENFLLDISK